MIRLEQTCGACPEQYDVYYNDEIVGYMRLRHGHFYAECPVGAVVYSSRTIGDGTFHESERERELAAATKAVLTRCANTCS